MDDAKLYSSCIPPQIPDTMKAVILKGKGFNKLVVDRTAVPQVGDNQLLCRVDAAGVCTSLLKIIKQGREHPLLNGWDPEHYPIILGDEGSLTIIKIGNNLKSTYSIGQRCALQPAVDLRPIVHRERYLNNARDMQKCAVGYTLGGCLARYILIQEEVLEGGCLIPLSDDDIPYFAAALAEPVSCVISAQKRHMHFIKKKSTTAASLIHGILPGGITLIIGAGIMGRINCEMALRFNPRHLIISDINTERLNQAQQNLRQKAEDKGIEFQAVPAAKLSEYLMRISNNKGADDIIVAVGSNQVQQQAFSLLNAKAVINLFGGLSVSERFLQVDSRQVHYDEITIIGSSGGDPADVHAALQTFSEHRLDPGNYVAGIASLEHTPAVLQLIESNQINGRVIIYPHASVSELMYVDRWDADREKKFLDSHLNKK
ncbi:MAG: zinc-binding dehydrogenase [Spirochaetales bacterium]|nr:zinc-binding dehydrogenase [Spirochaetales bacterium]